METAKKNKPSNSAFKQQRLKAWQPILTPNWVIGTFIVIGILFIPLGIVLLSAAEQVIEYQAVYDGALTEDTTYVANAQHQSSPVPVGTSKTITFDIKEKMTGPVYVYYELDNFYQNHRRYVKSRMDAQLRNKLSKTTLIDDENGDGIARAKTKFGADTTIAEWAKIFSRCEPMIVPPGVTTDCKYGTNATNGQPCKILWPCGLIAGSFFNDVFKSNQTGWTEKGIAWKSDLEKKFINPTGWDDGGIDKSSASVYQYLHQRYPRFNELTGGSLETDGVENEHFIVWMRTAGLPTFRKLYAIVEGGLEKGKFDIEVHSNFHVKSFSGNKKLIVSTVSWLGGKNYFLGVAYLVVGIISLLLALAFGIKHRMNPRKLGDSEYLVWSDKDKQS